ncbi:MAG TPA: hypothetical protein VMM80_02180 [Bacteroidota bacterium]|nr:hypothetical protein [Bacteroidota bacterium]
MRRSLVYFAFSCAIIAGAFAAPAGGTVGDALRRITAVEIPAGPLPVERTVAREIGARIVEASGTPAAPGTFRVRVERNVPDDAPPRFRFRIAADGTGELTASHPWLLYAALCRVREEWGQDDAATCRDGREGSVAIGWLEGNDGLFTGGPRFIRGYDPAATIRELARLGCSRVAVNVLAGTAPAEEWVPGEIYPRFYAYSPDLDQFVETDLTRGLYPPEYLQANLDLLRRNAALAVEYGLTPGLTVCSPRSMPEAFFAKYPYLRGARVDHPFRSYRPRYTATLSHPIVRWHYAQLMRAIMHEVPALGYLTLWTNDSGSGFEYVSTLYAGRNGGAYLIREWNSDSTIARAAGENVVRYLRLLRDAASETNPRFRVVTSVSWFGAEQQVILGGLGERLDLQVSSPAAGAAVLRAGPWRGKRLPPSLECSLRAAAEYVIGVPSPWLTLRRLRASGASPVSMLSVTFDPPALAPWSVNREIVRAFQEGDSSTADAIAERVARRWCPGGAEASALVRAWRMTDSAVGAFPDVPLYGNGWAFAWYRHWVRPFVPDIGSIPLAERAYYERHMIATFNNPTLVDFGADALWLLMDTHQASAIVRRADSLAFGPLDRGIAILRSLAPSGSAGAGPIPDQRDRLIALRCFFRTLRNIAGWVAGVHGYLDAQSAAGREESLRALRETIDDEIANATALRDLWNTTHTEFMPVASVGENSALYGENFGELLGKKIDLMRRHRNDTPAIDPAFMWQVPGSPVSPSEYLRY